MARTTMWLVVASALLLACTLIASASAAASRRLLSLPSAPNPEDSTDWRATLILHAPLHVDHSLSSANPVVTLPWIYAQSTATLLLSPPAGAIVQIEGVDPEETSLSFLLPAAGSSTAIQIVVQAESERLQEYTLTLSVASGSAAEGSRLIRLSTGADPPFVSGLMQSGDTVAFPKNGESAIPLTIDFLWSPAVGAGETPPQSLLDPPPPGENNALSLVKTSDRTLSGMVPSYADLSCTPHCNTTEGWRLRSLTPFAEEPEADLYSIVLGRQTVRPWSAVLTIDETPGFSMNFNEGRVLLELAPVEGSHLRIVLSLASGSVAEAISPELTIENQFGGDATIVFDAPKIYEVMPVGYTVRLHAQSSVYYEDVIFWIKYPDQPDDTSFSGTVTYTAAGASDPTVINISDSDEKLSLPQEAMGVDIDIVLSLPIGARLLDGTLENYAASTSWLAQRLEGVGAYLTLNFGVRSASPALRVQGYSLTLALPPNTETTFSAELHSTTGSVLAQWDHTDEAPIFTIPFAHRRSWLTVDLSMAPHASLESEYEIAPTQLQFLTPSGGESVSIPFTITSQDGLNVRESSFSVLVANSTDKSWSVRLTVDTPSEGVVLRAEFNSSDVALDPTVANILLPFFDRGRPMNLTFTLPEGATLHDNNGGLVPINPLTLPAPTSSNRFMVVPFKVASQDGEMGDAVAIQFELEQNTDNSWQVTPTVGTGDDAIPLTTLRSTGMERTIFVPFSHRGAELTLPFELPEAATLLNSSEAVQVDGIYTTTAPEAGGGLASIALTVRSQSGADNAVNFLVQTQKNSNNSWSAAATLGSGEDAQQLGSYSYSDADFTISLPWEKRGQSVAFEFSLPEGATLSSSVCDVEDTVMNCTAPSFGLGSLLAQFAVKAQDGAARQGAFPITIQASPERDWSVDIQVLLPNSTLVTHATVRSDSIPFEFLPLPFDYRGLPMRFEFSLSANATLKDEDSEPVPSQLIERTAPTSDNRNLHIDFSVVAQNGDESDLVTIQLLLDANTDNSWQMTPTVGSDDKALTLPTLRSNETDRTVIVPFSHRNLPLTLTFDLPEAAQLFDGSAMPQAGGVYTMTAPESGVTTTVTFIVQSQSEEDNEFTLTVLTLENSDNSWSAVATLGSGDDAQELGHYSHSNDSLTISIPWSRRGTSLSFHFSLPEFATLSSSVCDVVDKLMTCAAPPNGLEVLDANFTVMAQDDSQRNGSFRLAVEGNPDNSWQLRLNAITIDEVEVTHAVIRSTNDSIDRSVALPFEFRRRPMKLEFTLPEGATLRNSSGETVPGGVIQFTAPSSDHRDLDVKFTVVSQSGNATDPVTIAMLLDANTDNSWVVTPIVGSGEAELTLPTLRSSEESRNISLPFTHRNTTLTLQFTLPEAAELYHLALLQSSSNFSLTTPSGGGESTIVELVVRSQSGADNPATFSVLTQKNTDSSWSAVANIPNGTDTLELARLSSTDAKLSVSVPYALRGSIVSFHFILPEGAMLHDSSSAPVSDLLLTIASSKFGLGESELSFSVVAQDELHSTSGVFHLTVDPNTDNSWQLTPTATDEDGEPVPLDHLASNTSEYKLTLPFSCRDRPVTLQFTLPEGATLIDSSDEDDLDGTTVVTAPSTGGTSERFPLAVRAQSGAINDFVLTLTVIPNHNSSWTLASLVGHSISDSEELASLSSASELRTLHIPFARRGQTLMLFFTWLPEGATLADLHNLTVSEESESMLLGTAPTDGLDTAQVGFTVVAQNGVNSTSESISLVVDANTDRSWTLTPSVGVEGNSQTLDQLRSDSTSGFRAVVPFARRGQLVTLDFDLPVGATLRNSSNDVQPDGVVMTTAPAEGGAEIELTLAVRSQAEPDATSFFALIIAIARNNDTRWSAAAVIGEDETLLGFTSWDETDPDAWIVPLVRARQQILIDFDLPDDATLLDASGATVANKQLNMTAPGTGVQMTLEFTVRAQDESERAGNVVIKVEPNTDNSWTLRPTYLIPAPAAIPLPPLFSNASDYTVRIPFAGRGNAVGLQFELPEGATLIDANGNDDADAFLNAVAPAVGGTNATLPLGVRAQNGSSNAFELTLAVEPNSDKSWQLTVRSNGEQVGSASSHSATAQLSPSLAGAPLMLEWTLPEGSNWRAESGVEGEPTIDVQPSVTRVSLAVTAPAVLESISLSFVVIAQDGSEQVWQVTIAVLPRGDNGFTADLSALDGEFTRTLHSTDASLRVELPRAAVHTFATLVFTLPDGASWDRTSLTQSLLVPERGRSIQLDFTITAENGDQKAYTIELTVPLNTEAGFSLVASVGGFKSSPLLHSDSARTINLPNTAANSAVKLAFTLPVGASLSPAQDEDAAGLAQGLPLNRTVTVGAAGSSVAFNFTVLAESGNSASYSLKLKVAASSTVYTQPAVVRFVLSRDMAASLNLLDAATWQTLLGDLIGFPSRSGQQLNVTFEEITPSSSAAAAAARRLLASNDVRVTLTFVPSDASDDAAAVAATALGAQLTCLGKPTSAAQEACASDAAAKNGGQSLFSVSSVDAAQLGQAVRADSVQLNDGGVNPAGPVEDDDDGGLSDSERAAAIAVPVIVGGVLILVGLGMWLHRSRNVASSASRSGGGMGGDKSRPHAAGSELSPLPPPRPVALDASVPPSSPAEAEAEAEIDQAPLSPDVVSIHLPASFDQQA